MQHLLHQPQRFNCIHSELCVGLVNIVVLQQHKPGLEPRDEGRRGSIRDCAQTVLYSVDGLVHKRLTKVKLETRMVIENK